MCSLPYAGFNSFHDGLEEFCVQKALKRSMCSLHYAGFNSFHDGLEEFCMMVANADRVIQDPIFNIFPFAPEKVRLQDWDQFDEWLHTEDEDPIRDLCIPWCNYGRDKIQECEECEHLSNSLGWGTDDSGSDWSDDEETDDESEVEVEPDPDNDDEEDEGSDEQGSDNGDALDVVAVAPHGN
ncbi:hypothetical protein FRX31_031071, partial [Thalictrum thalictroides]